MSDRELRDRFEALETLTTQLIRTLHRTGVLSDADRDQVLDSLEEISIGDRGVAFAAETLAEGISPRSPGATVEEGMVEISSRDEYNRRLYAEPENGS